MSIDDHIASYLARVEERGKKLDSLSKRLAEARSPSVGGRCDQGLLRGLRERLYLGIGLDERYFIDPIPDSLPEGEIEGWLCGKLREVIDRCTERSEVPRQNYYFSRDQVVRFYRAGDSVNDYWAERYRNFPVGSLGIVHDDAAITTNYVLVSFPSDRAFTWSMQWRDLGIVPRNMGVFKPAELRRVHVPAGFIRQLHRHGFDANGIEPLVRVWYAANGAQEVAHAQQRYEALQGIVGELRACGLRGRDLFGFLLGHGVPGATIDSLLGRGSGQAGGGGTIRQTLDGSSGIARGGP